MEANCVLFSGHIGNAGYGLDYEPETQKTILAHRKAYKDYYGVLESNLIVMHLCNNKACVNPLHLKQGTQSENIKQAYKDGLQINPHRKLNADLVLAIDADPDLQKNIAIKYGVSKTIVKNIKHGKTYRDITGKGGSCGV